MRRITIAFALFMTTAAALLAQNAAYRVHTLPLPSGTADGILMDYIAYDPATGFIWVPAGNTGAVDVVDTRTNHVRQISDLAAYQPRFYRDKVSS